jgi:hypothetical protein
MGYWIFFMTSEASPGHVDVDRVRAHAYDGSLQLLEPFIVISQLLQLRGADKAEIGGVEGHDQPASPVILEVDGGLLALH